MAKVQMHQLSGSMACCYGKMCFSLLPVLTLGCEVECCFYSLSLSLSLAIFMGKLDNILVS